MEDTVDTSVLQNKNEREQRAAAFRKISPFFCCLFKAPFLGKPPCLFLYNANVV